MKTINVNNTIENFLSGNASNAEKSWLNREMKKDPDLAREVALRRRTDEILADREILDLRAKLNAVEIRKRSAGGLRKVAERSSRYAAAILVAAAVTSAIYFMVRPDPSPEKLYTSYYERYESPGASRSAITAGNLLMENAIASYSAKEYDKAIGYLEQVIANENGNMESLFMHGMANMEVSNYPVASGSFTRVIEHNDNLYLEDAAWYLSLCYMMTGNSEKALSQLNAIADSRSRYSRQAARLAKRIR
jgi:tetratricopeptide (TPR) repeat protein